MAMPSLHPMLSPAAPKLAAPVIVDQYADAPNWCFDVDDLQPCRRPGDTSADPNLPTRCDPDPHTGRERVCLNPWWVPGTAEVCVPKTSTAAERTRWKDELEAFIYRRDRGTHHGVCRPQSWWRAGQGHRVDDGKCNPDGLQKLLRIVSWREVRHDPRWTHLMVGDTDAAFKAWRQKRKLYANNAHYRESWRWRSRGYGQIPAYHLHRWDKNAPPEVLCRRVIATEVYLETLRDCYGGVSAKLGETPTWYDLHRCASSGKFTRPDSIPEHKGFVQRARAVKLDPFERVPREWLGEPIDHDMQTVREIEEEISSFLDRKKKLDSGGSSE